MSSTSGFQFTERDAEIVNYVYQLRVATLDHLAALTNRSYKTLERRVPKLRDERYLRRPKDHFETGNRQQAMARIATGNYDAVIVSHRSFEFLPVSDKYFNRFVEKQVAELDAEIGLAKDSKDDSRRMVKELEKAKKRLTVRLKKRADRESKDSTMTFEELGVDQLFVDEADLYKNLAYVTKMNRIAGLPNSDSNRAFDMFLKIRYLQERSDGRGVVFATGTPISNTLAEMYTMLRYLGPEMLSERKVDHFDSWAANFAEAVTSLELAPDGSGYRMHTRFAKFINLPELLSVFRTVADVSRLLMRYHQPGSAAAPEKYQACRRYADKLGRSCPRPYQP
jgi:N12 class adenine-specific DNA methylase